MSSLKRILRLFSFSLYSLAGGWVLFFLLFETFPSLLNLLPMDDIRYYALKRKYVSDPELVFSYRGFGGGVREHYAYEGDMFTSAYGVPSVLAQLSCDVKVGRRIPRNVFFPVPNVDSVLVVL